VESAVTASRTPVSRLYAREAFRLIHGHLERVLDEPGDVAARGAMLWGAHLAGAAIEASMLGATHACANPLTARRHVTHGVAVGVMLPHVVRYNAADAPERYDTLGAGSPERLIERLVRIQSVAGLPARLRDCGVEGSDLDVLADDAARQWTAGFNPRPVDRAALRELYAAAY